MITLTDQLCAAIVALLDDADVAIDGEHPEGALDRVLQAEAVLKIARDVACTHADEARLFSLNQRIEQVCQRGVALTELLQEAV